MSNVSNFKVGDVVRLKTGGPRMTVEGVGQFMRALHDAKPSGLDSGAAIGIRAEQSKDDVRTVWCVWFLTHDNSGPYRERFDHATIEVASS